MNFPEIRKELEIFELVYFLGAEFIWNCRGGLLLFFKGTCISKKGPGPCYNINNFFFLLFIFHKDLMKVLYFSK